MNEDCTTTFSLQITYTLSIKCWENYVLNLGVKWLLADSQLSSVGDGSLKQPKLAIHCFVGC